MGQHAEGSYYVPHGTKWPMTGSIGLATMLVSAALWLNGSDSAMWTFYVGLAIIIYMVFGWFGQVIRESEAGMYNAQVDTSFRMGMSWFIFSEVMFFACFFGALFYARALPFSIFLPSLSLRVFLVYPCPSPVFLQLLASYLFLIT